MPHVSSKTQRSHRSHSDRSEQPRSSPDDRSKCDTELTPSQQLVERAAAAYFNTCRRVARAINRLKA